MRIIHTTPTKNNNMKNEFYRDKLRETETPMYPVELNKRMNAKSTIYDGNMYVKYNTYDNVRSLTFLLSSPKQNESTAL